MKQSDIEKIISENPNAVFRINRQYGSYALIVTGFKKESTKTYSNRTSTYAVGFRIRRVEYDGRVLVEISEHQHNIPLRQIVFTGFKNLEEYKASEQNAIDKRIAKEEADHAQKVKAYDLRDQLLALGFNAEVISGYSREQKIVINLEATEEIVKLLKNKEG